MQRDSIHSSKVQKTLHEAIELKFGERTSQSVDSHQQPSRSINTTNGADQEVRSAIIPPSFLDLAKYHILFF